MLYDLWCEVAAARAGEIALREVGTGRTWTFAELRREGESPLDSGEDLVFPTGTSARFIVDILRAWRAGKATCPIEVGQTLPVIPHPAPAGCVHWKLTSATTGAPRLVAFNAAQLEADAWQIIRTMGLRPEWPNLGVISMAHSYGFSNLVLPLLLGGIPLVLSASPLPESLREASAGLEALTLPAVPALWRTWFEAGVIPTGTRLAISAGAVLPLELERRVFESTGIKIHNFYGATECGGIAYDRTALPREDPAWVGTALEGVRVGVGPEGCLVVHSAAAGLGSWPDSDTAPGAGCYRTGDLAEVGPAGIYLRGRAADTLNVAGRKVSPEVIERVIQGCPGVRECLVFGAPAADAVRGDVIVAVVVADGPDPLGPAQDAARQHLPGWQVPREWWCVDSLGESVRGKVSRARWREKYLARAAARLG